MDDGKITYHQQVSFCGKERCRRCRDGIGHGPYWYAYRTVNGRTVRTYVGKDPPANMQVTRAAARKSASPTQPATVLRFYTLGQFRLEQRVRGDGQESTDWEQITEASLQHQRVRSLLSCLVSTPGRKLGREQVMYMLWPDLDLDTATHRLDRAVHNLRQVFEPGRSRPSSSTLLLTEYSTLVLAEQPQLWIDADAFEQLLAAARATDDPGEAEQLLEEAAALYNGEFLPEEVQITAVLSRRETLRRGWITLLLELADLRIEREAIPAAIEVLDRLLTTDPTNEAAAQRLIALLAQTGRRGEAIAAYQRLAKALKQEFQISTLPETRTLFDAVLSGGNVPKPRTQTRRAATPPAELAPVTRASDTDHMHIGRTHQSPLVGRDEEMERLHNVLQITEQTRRLKLTGQKRPSVFAPLSLDTQRRAQFITLMGDVGIGKTRLAEEAAREAKRRNWAVAWCRAYVQESNVPYRMWTEILRKAMSQGLWQRQELTRRPLVYQPLGMLLPELQDILPEVLYAPLPPEQEKLRLWESTRALLSTICENTTLLIVLDDVQWADGSSCELLTYLVRQMRGMPVMFLSTCREVELPDDHPLRKMMNDMTREQAIEILPIKPLSHEQIRHLIAHLPVPVVDVISKRASGNPFFAEELARGVTVGDLLPAFDPLNPAGLPETITAVLDLRLARITEKCQRLLERAAVLDDAFHFETICAMASGSAPPDEELILDLLEEGLQAGMLVEEGQGANITFTFWHPLLQTYLYERLSAARRASLHRRAAQVMQEHYNGRESEGAAKITYHLVHGGGPPTQIARYAELAANRDYSLSAYLDAEKHYRLVLEYLGPLASTASPSERLHYAYLHEQLGECTMIVGKFEAARTFYEQVLALRAQQQAFATEAERAYAAQLEALLWCEISRAWRYLGNGEQAMACSTQSENVLRAAGVEAGPAWARIRYQQGHTLWLEGNLTEALSLGHEALQRFKASQALPLPTDTTHPPTQAQRILNGDTIGLGRVYTLLAGVETDLGKNDETLKHLNLALAVFEENGIKNELANVCCNLGDLYLKRAEYTLAHSMLTRSHTLAKEIGNVPIMSIALANLGVLATRLGDLTEAENWYQQALAQIKQTSELFYTSLFHSYFATALIEQGKLNEAKPLLAQALKISYFRHIAPCTGFALVVLGQLRLAHALASDLSENAPTSATQRASRKRFLWLVQRARLTLQRALTYDGLEADVKLHSQLLLARIALLLEELDEAHTLVTQAQAEACSSELVWLQARAQSLLGLILAQQEQPEAATAAFTQALHTFERTGMRLEHARTLYIQATLLLEAPVSAQRRQAVTDLAQARKIFQECQATLDLRIAEGLLTTRIAPPTKARPRKEAGKAR